MTPRKTGERYRRSPGLVLYWSGTGQPHCFNTATSTRFPITLRVVNILDGLDRWNTARALVKAQPGLGSHDALRELLETLADLGLLERRSQPHPPWLWKEWFPEAAFFHFGVRGARYAGTPFEYDANLRRKAVHTPPPAPTKRVAGPRVALPPARSLGQFSKVLSERRTWRRFARQPIALPALATLLRWTWGVQKRARVRGQGPIVLKTSPSGGARHPLEAYVLAMDVTGLASGSYHYDAATHELVAITRGLDRQTVARLIADQEYFANASAIIVMTSVFARKMWRYPYSRAYASVLVEAGHFAQTFCLAATALGLAPFCTMAFREQELEALIGVDGQSECAMYVVGVGTRPRGRVANPGRMPR